MYQRGNLNKLLDRVICGPKRQKSTGGIIASVQSIPIFCLVHGKLDSVTELSSLLNAMLKGEIMKPFPDNIKLCFRSSDNRLRNVTGTSNLHNLYHFECNCPK